MLLQEGTGRAVPAPRSSRRGLAGLGGACLLILLFPIAAQAFDRFTATYGLREYYEYNDNLFYATEGEPKVRDGSINTAPDLSIVYDDGETRWLARGSYRRESFIDNSEGSGNYFALSGEFSRVLNDRMTFSLLGGFTDSSAIELGRVLTEPGQRNVVRPIRGEPTTGTLWSPSLSIFWSKRFGTTLAYEESQVFTENSLGTVEKSVSLSGYYALTPNTILKGVVVGVTNRNSGLPLADKSDVNSFVARFGFLHTFSRRFTMDLSAGPQWTKDVNLPRNVTVLYNGRVRVTDPLFGTSVLVDYREPGQRVQDLSLGLSVNLRLNYQFDSRTNLSLFLAQGTTSGEGAAGAQATQELQFNLTRQLSSNWGLALRAGWLKQTSIDKDVIILFTPDPFTGETQALDRRSFDINARLEQRQLTVEPRITYRVNSWMSAYASWNWTQLENEFVGATTRVNRVQLGLELRKDAYY